MISNLTRHVFLATNLDIDYFLLLIAETGRNSTPESWCVHVKERAWGWLGQCTALTVYAWELIVSLDKYNINAES